MILAKIRCTWKISVLQ